MFTENPGAEFREETEIGSEMEPVVNTLYIVYKVLEFIIMCGKRDITKILED